MVLYCGVNRKTEWDSNGKTNTSDSKLEIYIFIFIYVYTTLVCFVHRTCIVRYIDIVCVRYVYVCNPSHESSNFFFLGSHRGKHIFFAFP